MLKSTIFLSRYGWHLEQSVTVFETVTKISVTYFHPIELYRQQQKHPI